MYHHAVPMFLGTVSSMILLVLITVSAPLIRLFYFVKTSADDDLRFGVWGYCTNGTCSSVKLGYTYETKVTQPTSYLLVLFPAAAGLSLICALALTPLLCFPRTRRFPHVLFCLTSFLAAAVSIAGFVIMVYITAVAMTAFQKEGYSTHLGPLIWMSLVSSVVLFLVALNAGCGTCLGGKFGRQPSYSY